MLLRTVTFDGYSHHPTRTTEMTRPRQGAEATIDQGVYIHRDDLADAIRRLATNGAKGLPNIATAVPAHIADLIQQQVG